MTDEQIRERVLGFEYIRDGQNNPIGVVVLDNEHRIGWSLYNEKHEDQPASKDKGIFIALNRAKTVPDPTKDLIDRYERTYLDLGCDRLESAICFVDRMKERRRKILSNEGDDE